LEDRVFGPLNGREQFFILLGKERKVSISLYQKDTVFQSGLKGIKNVPPLQEVFHPIDGKDIVFFIHISFFAKEASFLSCLTQVWFSILLDGKISFNTESSVVLHLYDKKEEFVLPRCKEKQVSTSAASNERSGPVLYVHTVLCLVLLKICKYKNIKALKYC
jgi:hypothetical protein